MNLFGPKMPRREKPVTRMRKAVDSKDPQEYAWGLLELCRVELREEGTFKTLTSTDIKNLIQSLINNEIKEEPEEKQESATIADIRDYLNK